MPVKLSQKFLVNFILLIFPKAENIFMDDILSER